MAISIADEVGVYMRFHMSKFTVFMIFFIMVSTLFMNQTAKFIEKSWGKEGEEAILGMLFIVVFVLAVMARSGKGLFALQSVFFFIFLFLGLVLAWRIKNPAERVHIIEYGILGWSAAHDFSGARCAGKGLLAACIMGLIVGFADELIQMALPYRVFDTRDIFFNGLGTLWGVAVFVLHVLKRC
ncbi:MAG: VanZ family protein [Candidatus Omnitrophica bacterium]|nr:VanZ family protein [Candidatus Omnitrophota bacterium]